MNELTQKEQLDSIMKRPIPRKRIGIIRLEMVREGKVLYGMRRFSGAEEVADMIRPLVKNRDRELMLVLSLDSKLQPMALEIVSVGGVDCYPVDIRCLFKHALLNNASFIICLHNHPSGIPDASNADRQVTRRMQQAGEILGIRLLDHIVIGDESYYSLKEAGELGNEQTKPGINVSFVAEADQKPGRSEYN